MTDTPRPRRKAKNTFTTRSGNTIKLNRSLGDRIKANRDAKARRKAAYLSTLPRNPWKRALYRMEPRRLFKYWFSRDGAIMALKITGIGIVVCFLFLVGLFAYFRKDLPAIKDLSGNNFGGSITYYDRTGQTVLWQDYDAVKRVPVASNQISDFMKKATVAVEDKNFYKHGAFDVKGITRAALHDASGGGGSSQGGSTITQQLVKLNEGWTNDHTIGRKVKELILAVELERQYTKDDILSGYLNIAPYGGVDYGVESAARDYFGVDANQLSLAQAAMLAAIPKAPGSYSPYNSPKFNSAVTGNLFDANGLIARQQYILDLMAKQGDITQSQASDAKKVDILSQVKPLQTLYSGIKAPYFVLAAKQQLENKYGAAVVNRGGWKVTTTLDLSLQNSTEQIVANNLPNVRRITGGAADEEATVAEDVQTGQIVALVGGVDFTNPQYGQNNYAAGILIPPGSSFKPYDYTTFINNNTNVGAGSVLYDAQGALPGYPCTSKQLPKNGGNCLEDYDFLYPGPITLRYALGGSRNVPAVKAMLSAVPNDQSTGKVSSVNKVISTASAMMDNPFVQGNTYNCYADEALSKTTQCYGASAIGDGAFLHLDDHVNGLSTLARLGSAIPRTYILKIVNSANKNVYQWTQPQGTQVVKQDAAYIVNNMASDPNASYLPGSCSATTCTKLSSGGYKFQRDNGWNFAVKTGTTNNGFDGLMTSWSTHFAVVSWVGNHDRNVDLTAARGASMEMLTEPITRGVMEAAHANIKPVNWTQPADIKTAPAFILRNHIHYGDIEPSPSNDLFPSWYVNKSGASSSSQVIDKVSGLVATSCTPALAKQTNSNSNANSWNVDIFYGGSSSASTSNSPAITASDNIHNCGDTQPTATVTQSNCDAAGKCDFVVAITQGTNSSSGAGIGLSGGSYTSSPAGTLSLIVNGQTAQTISIPTDATSPYSYTFSGVSVSDGVSVTAQVVDSELYSGTSSPTTVTLPATGTGTGTGTGNNHGG